MRKNRLLSIFVIVLLIVVACREEEPLPTAVPTVTIPTPIPTSTPIATDSGTETAVAPPAPIQIDSADIDWPPQVIYSSPAPGEEVLLNGAITIRFDQPMNQQAVEAAFSVTPTDGSQKVSGNFSWPRSDTMVFTPQADYQRRQMYRVEIGETAASANGLTLEVPLELTLQTVGALAVSQIIPADGSADVQTDGAITVLFNRPVVPLVGSGQQAALPQPLQIEPAISGQGEWVSTSIYRFVPDEPLAGATTYRIAIDESLTDVVGVSLASSFASQFTTLSPDIVSIQPDSTANLMPTAPITVTFNMPMDRAATEAAVSLTGFDAPAAEIAYEWLEDDRVLQITPQQILALDTTYQLQVNNAARAANGTATLPDGETVIYQTVPLPGIVRTVPAAGGLADRFQRGVTIQFASPMDWETVEGNIRIDPEPTNVRTFINQFSNEISLDFNLELNTTYTIIVPGFVADPYGNTLGEPVTFRFTTPGRVPIASLGLPPRLSQFSTSFATTVDVIHVNVSRLDVALYDVGLPLNLLNRPFDVTDYRPAAVPISSWSLPQTSERDAVNTVTIPLAGEGGGTLTPGVYFLTVDAPETGSDVQFWQNQRNLLVVADTNIVVKEMFGAVHVWVTELRTGLPAANQSLTLYSEQGVALGTAVSDSNGFAEFSYSPTNDFLEGVTVVSGQPGQEGFGIGSSIWDEGIRPWELDVPATSGEEVETIAYIYTDRPIYRPGDTVQFKGIVRNSNYGRYLPTELTTLDLRFADFYRGGETAEQPIVVNIGPDGSFSGDYQLPEDAALGTYQLFAQNPQVEAFRLFTVAEYRAPEFQVALTPAQPEQLRGESVTIDLEASYFFGGPATDLPVEWSVYERAYQPEYTGGPYFSFGDGGGFFYQDPGLFGGFGGPGGFGNFVLKSNGRTDENGRLQLTLPANLLQDAESGSRIITVEATIFDISEFPVTSRTVVTLHAGEVYVGIQPEAFIGRAGSESAVNLQTIGWDGTAVSNQEVEIVFYRREWVSTRTQDFGIYYTRWEPVDTEVARTRVATDGLGEATASFTPEEGGTYVAVATVTDDGGRAQFSSTTIWVADSGRIGWQVDPRDKTMDLTPDATSYAPGDTARLLVQSPFSQPVQAWLTIERGQLLEQRLITVNGSSDVLEIPVTPAMAPNAFVTVTAIKGVTSEGNPYPEMRLGIAELSVSVEQQTLIIALTPQQETFGPGETAVYTITVTDHQGNPVQADLSLALVDLAVLTLKEDNAPNIVDAFYASQPYRSRMGSGLIFSGEGYPVDVPIEQLGLGGGGGGDVALETTVARLNEEDEDGGVRQDFPDTAFWQANLTTDANGQATVEIPLPDNLTTWRLSSKAVTPETLVGQNSVDIITTLPLLVRSVTPRFFTAGDVVELGAVVNNNTGDALETTVTLQATGVTLSGPETHTVTVPANGQMLVRWPVTVQDVAGVDLTFRVEGGGYSDATKPAISDGGEIPVYRYTGNDVVATAGQLDAAGNRVEAILLPPGVDVAQGEVAINLSPSLAAVLVDGIALNNETPYSSFCAYAITDRMLPNVALLNLDRRIEGAGLAETAVTESEQIVQTSLNQLEALALPDGGWGWCSSVQSDPWLTGYTLFGLAQARELGYSVKTTVLENGANYLARQLVSPSPQLTSFEVNRQAFFLYVLAQLNPNVAPDLDRLVAENRALLDPYGRALVALAYAQLDLTSNQMEMLLTDLNDSAILSATGTHWEDASRDMGNLNSNVRGTAVVLQALATLEPESPLLPGAVRWLMSARTASAHGEPLWATSHETAWTIFALTEWLVATGELDANYDYSLEVNLQPVTDGRFTTNTVTDSRMLSLPLDDLLLEEANFFNFGRGDGDGRLYYTMHLESSIAMNFVQPVNRGVSVERVYYDAACNPDTETCEPITQIEAGQQVRVVLTIITENDLVYARIEDPIPAGTEALDPGLNINSPTQGGQVNRVDEDYRYGYWGWWYFNRIEYRDEQVVFLANFLPAGTYQYSYFLQATIPGEYQVRPTFAHETFFPEVNGRSAGLLFTIVP
ncbi:Ig-like domain-containing protein [Candidatus Leptofilum sp.]|uniref:Ig-like domain-containing protein n=1 Tax=Candidatus Leptofilum sp. TaxID=3241576 RepID=UPI003B5BFD3C